MSACEKCWADSQRGLIDQAGAYRRLVAERNCTPEQQAGPHATECPTCARITIHQHTGECMAGCQGG